MSSIKAPASRRRAHGASHLREVSNDSSNTIEEEQSDTGTIQHDPRSPMEQQVVLWVHDDGFSKEDVVLNLDLFPDVRAGDLMAIVASKTEPTTRDFQDKSQSTRKDTENIAASMRRDRSSSYPRSPGPNIESDTRHGDDVGKRYVFIAKDMPKDMKTKQPDLKLSVAKHIADLFNLRHRSNVLLTTAEASSTSASHVEMSFRDEYLARSDMWRLAVTELSNKTVFKGQKILFMGTIKAQVTCLYVNGQKVQSAFFSTDTKPIFRSESARYVLFVQMSREMWDFDSEGSGEIMFNKVVNGFLPALFKKWVSLKAKHLVSIVLFTRVEYDIGIASELAGGNYDPSYHTGIQTDGNKRPYKDFYRVVVSEMASGSWTTILHQLKREFKFFRRDISLHRINNLEIGEQTLSEGPRGVPGTRIEAEPSLAMHGNVLEAINLASSQFSHDYIDRDLMRTGISIVVITPCAGLFEVDYETLKTTTESLIGNGIGIDLVCLPKMPLHSVPIFRYRNPQFATFQEALHVKSIRSEGSTPRQNAPAFGSSFSSVDESLSPTKLSHLERTHIESVSGRGTLTTSSQPFYHAIGSPTDPPSEWSYAIPHWIDVSYWTGASQDIYLTNPSAKSVRKYLKRKALQRATDFEIRCKMYELEMASVTGSDIFTPPLHQDSLFRLMMLQQEERKPNTPLQTSNSIPEDGVVHLERRNQEAETARAKRKIDGSARKQDLVHTPGYVKLRKKHTGIHEFPYAKSKADKITFQGDTQFYQALDLFDLTKSEILRSSKHGNGATKSFTPESESTSKKLLRKDCKLLRTSLSEDNQPSKEAGSVHTITPSVRIKKVKGEREDNPRSSGTFINSETISGSGALASSKRLVSKDNTANSGLVNSAVASPHLSPRAPRLGRQISLGKLGFGITAPKAATAEIQTEHASGTKASAQLLDSRKASANAVAHHLLATGTLTQSHDRPSSSRSDSTKSQREVSISSGSSSVDEPVENDKNSFRRPMTIRSALQSLDSTNQFKSRSVLGSLYESGDHTELNQPNKYDDQRRVYNSKLLAGSVPELPATLSPTTALSPWLSVLNPSNPSVNDVLGPSQYRRWQHVFPKPVKAKTMKWKSLCSPASVPLTTEYFPTKQQLESEYERKSYTIFPSTEDDLSDAPKSIGELLRELMSLRLSQGFQIVVGSSVAEAFGQKTLKIANAFDRDRAVDDGSSVFMSMGNIIHQLSCGGKTEIEVNMFVRKPMASPVTGTGPVSPTIYNSAIRTTLALGYESRPVTLGSVREEYNWNYVDTFIAGLDEEMSENLRFWRARFVLIPVERPTQSQRKQGEDNEEEIRLEGIKKLTQMWQKHRVLTASERRSQKQTLASRKLKDPNPLDIVYKTEDPSVVVTAELETLPLVELGDGGPRLLESDRFRTSRLDVPALADAIQSPAERGGVRMQNRRWHFRLHYNCFIGSDMTTWLLENFEDIETREEAVDLGNRLMAKDELPRIREREIIRETGRENNREGIFVHVEKRHPFRDGQYFYQVTGEFARQRPESRSGWFGSRRRDTSVPSTPMTESMRDLPRPVRSRSSSTREDFSSESDATTPTSILPLGKRPKVALSKVMKYDVDHRKRSYRPERINLHYDRLHNPDNCYHIRIDWMGVTAKLIEDAIESWATFAERYGLRLVEAPIGEASAITSIHPFRSCYTIDLTVQPPDQQPKTYFDASSFAPQAQTIPASRHYYQKAIMKRFNFVLDIEAARNFPSNVDVTYSWGRPDFKYTQYIHRSGIVLAQITDEGNFLLLANRLFNNRTMAARETDRYVKTEYADRGSRMASSSVYGMDRATPINSPMIRPVTTTSSSPHTAGVGSPLIRATSDVLGSSLVGSKLANSITPESIKEELELFCNSADALEIFYKEILEKVAQPNATPPNLRSPYASVLLDHNIPTLGLPPGVLARDASPTPFRLSSMPTTGIGNSIQQFGRRPSYQVGSSSNGGDSLRQDSPRGSIIEGEKMP